MVKKIFLGLSRLLVFVLVVVLSSSCQNQRQESIAYTTAGGCGGVITLEGVQPSIETDFCVYRAKWSPNGKRMLLTVMTEFGISVWVANADGTNPRQVSPEFDMVTSTWLNNDFLLIDAITGDTRPSAINSAKLVNYTLDLRDGTVRVYSHDLQLSVVPMAGDQWLTLGNMTGICLQGLEGNTTRILQEYSIDRDAFDISPSGHEIVFFDYDISQIKGHLYKADLKGDNVVEPAPVYTLDYLARVKWSPDGKYVALLDNQYTLHVLSTTDFSLAGEFDLGRLEDNSFIWSPHSDAVMVSRWYGESWETSEIARVDIRTGAITRLTNNDKGEFISDWRIIAK